MKLHQDESTTRFAVKSRHRGATSVRGIAGNFSVRSEGATDRGHFAGSRHRGHRVKDCAVSRAHRGHIAGIVRTTDSIGIIGIVYRVCSRAFGIGLVGQPPLTGGALILPWLTSYIGYLRTEGYLYTRRRGIYIQRKAI